jgi:hypothetical protein
MSDIVYVLHGDYFLPNIVLNEPPKELVEPITKYGAMRRAFLREHYPIIYNQLLLSEQLFPHLWEVQYDARNRLNSLMSEMLIFRPPPDKKDDSLAWAAHMTKLKHTAEKMMLEEIAYV